jgi:hypothetical protein
MVGSAGYLDVAVLAFVGLIFVGIAMLFARTAKRALWFLFSWALAFVVLNGILGVLNAFPAYALLRDAVWTAFRRVVLPAARGTGSLQTELWAVFRDEVQRMARSYVAPKDEL